MNWKFNHEQKFIFNLNGKQVELTHQDLKTLYEELKWYFEEENLCEE